MMEQLKPALEQALIGLLEGIKTAKDFVLAEAPEIIQQLLAWKTFEFGTTLVIGIALLIGTAKLIRMAIEAENTSDYMEDGFGLFMVASITGIIGAVCFFCGLTVIKLIIAPKVYLLEYVSLLIK